MRECKDCNEGLNIGSGLDWCDRCYSEYVSERLKFCADYGDDNCICNRPECTKISKKTKKKFLALWYSVSPPRDEDYTVEKGLLFISRVRKFIQANSIQKAIYAFEWKYKDDNPNNFYGIHCRMLRS